MHIWIRLSGCGHQQQKPIFWQEVLLKTGLQYKSLDGLIGFLMFLVRKLWPKKSRNVGKIPRNPFGDNLKNKQWGYFETISSMRIIWDYLLKKNKQWGYFETSPQWELSDDILHILIACVLVKLLPFKNMSRINDFDDYPFPLPQSWSKGMDFLKFFFTSTEKTFEKNLSQVLATIKWLHLEWFSFKVSWWFSC